MKKIHKILIFSVICITSTILGFGFKFIMGSENNNEFASYSDQEVLFKETNNTIELPDQESQSISFDMSDTDGLDGSFAGTNENNIELSKETVSELENLVKTYLVSSMSFEWEIVKSISTGSYLEKLETTIIPSMATYMKEQNIIYDFNPRTIATEIVSYSTDECIVSVDYIAKRGYDEKNMISSQERVSLTLVKVNGIWKISQVI